MNYNRKIKAFTLTEMLVVIVISAIVVGIAFTVLNLVQQNYNSIRQNYRTSSEILHLKQRLSIDFNRFHKVIYNKHLNEVHLKNPIDSITYLFIDNKLVRNRDTLPLPIDHIIFYFEGNKVKNGKVDAMKLFLKEWAESNIFIYKTNDAKTYMTGNGN